MRKYQIILLLAVLAQLLCACKGDKGEPGRNGAASIQIVVINVPQESWQYSDAGSNNYFFATVDMPEIPETVFDGGLIKMYRTFNYDTKNATQMEMPYIRHSEMQNQAGEWIFYTETVDYEFGIGTITVYYTASDFDYELDNTFVPEAMQFRCVIMY